MEKLIIVKIGGKVIDEDEFLLSFLKDFSKIPGKKILVHGGGKIATDISKALGIQPQLVEGRRITTAADLKVVTMVYGGLINKKIVSQLQAYNCNALGLTGADANIILAQKRAVTHIDYGFVGDVEEVHIDPLIDFLNSGFVPVIAPMTHDKKGSLLNTNADTIANSLASALADHYEIQLIYCFDQKGVLYSKNDQNSIIPEIALTDYRELKTAGVISGGMIPKIDNAFHALENGVTSVLICDARNLLEALENRDGIGTRILMR